MAGQAEKQRWAALRRLTRRTMRGYTPPKMQTVTQWAEENIILGTENAEPGAYRVSRTPYAKEIMDAFTEANIHDITVVAGAQVSKTMSILNMMCYSIAEDPSTMIYMQPTVDDCKRFSRLRIASTFRLSPALRGKIAEEKSRSGGNTLMQKMFPGGSLILVGTNAPSGLASTPARYIFADEVDRFADSAGNEGDPLSLARARSITFYNHKTVAVSTPTSTQRSKIYKLFLEGTQERWKHQCPGCGNWYELKFADLKFDRTTVEAATGKETTVQAAAWECPGCKHRFSQRQMRKTPAKWAADRPEAISKGHRSFWLTPLDSPWLSWEEIGQKWFDSDGDILKRRAVVNTYLGELWEDRGEVPDPTGLLARREDYGETADGRRVEVPAGVLAITCGVDTQDDRLEYEVVGYGLKNESWGIRRGVLLGDPNEPEVWAQLDEILNHDYIDADGNGRRIEYTFVDAGGHRTDAVYLQCGLRFHRQVFAIFGRAGDGKPLTEKPKLREIVRNGRSLGKIWYYNLGVDTGKSLIYTSLAVHKRGPNYMHFPLRAEAGYDYDYFNGLCSETQVLKVANGISKFVWEKLPGHERNEPLDCRDYANAACFALVPDMEARAEKAAQPAAPTQNAPRHKVRRIKGNL